MPRPVSDEMYVRWKLSIPAPLAGKVEFTLLDPIASKAKYGSRSKLIVSLLEGWIAGRENGLDPTVAALKELYTQPDDYHALEKAKLQLQRLGVL